MNHLLRTTVVALVAILASSAPSLAGGPRQSIVVGEPFAYVLEGTPGTGAQWTFDADASVNAAILSVESLGYGEPSNNLIGGPAPFTFEITGLEPGTARLVFVYGRSWEPEPFRTETLRLRVRGRPTN